MPTSEAGNSPGQRRRRGLMALVAAALCIAGTARAELKIEITSGVRDPVPIAVVPFAQAPGADGGLDVAGVIQHDLEGSGRFKGLARERMPATPTQADQVVVAKRKGAGSDYVV